MSPRHNNKRNYMHNVLVKLVQEKVRLGEVRTDFLDKTIAVD